MQHLSFERFSILAHDRGARVAHRLLLDHGELVDKCVLLDIAPTLWMYEGTDMAFVRPFLLFYFFFLLFCLLLLPHLPSSQLPVSYTLKHMGYSLPAYTLPAWTSVTSTSSVLALFFTGSLQTANAIRQQDTGTGSSSYNPLPKLKNSSYRTHMHTGQCWVRELRIRV